MLAEVPVWYTAVVPLPLALPDILQRLKSNYYRHVDALQHDAGTIASNAELYNGVGSDVAKTAAGEALIACCEKREIDNTNRQKHLAPMQQERLLIALVASIAQQLPVMQTWRGALWRL